MMEIDISYILCVEYKCYKSGKQIYASCQLFHLKYICICNQLRVNSWKPRQIGHHFENMFDLWMKAFESYLT